MRCVYLLGKNEGRKERKSEKEHFSYINLNENLSIRSLSLFLSFSLSFSLTPSFTSFFLSLPFIHASVVATNESSFHGENTDRGEREREKGREESEKGRKEEKESEREGESPLPFHSDTLVQKPRSSSSLSSSLLTHSLSLSLSLLFSLSLSSIFMKCQ